MANWTLSEIRTKTRQVSGRLSVSELSNSQIDEYINKYFQFEFPAEVKLNRNYTLHEFNTTADTQDYDFPANFTNFVPDATLDRREILFYQNPDAFYRDNPENITRVSPWAVPATAAITGFTNANPGVLTVSTTTGFNGGDSITVSGITETGAGTTLNGTFTIASKTANTITTGTDTSAFAVYASSGTVTQIITAFSTTLSGLPIVPGSIIVDDKVEVLTDTDDGDGTGTLTGDKGGSGDINYSTGVLNVTFNTAPTANNVVQVSYIQFRSGFSTSVLMFENKFKFFPIPDRAYRFRIKAWSLSYVKPVSGANQTTFILSTDKPLQEEWGPSIAFGAARRIASDFGEMDRYSELTVLYKEQINYILKRTHIDLESSRALPMF